MNEEFKCYALRRDKVVELAVGNPYEHKINALSAASHMLGRDVACCYITQQVACCDEEIIMVIT